MCICLCNGNSESSSRKKWNLSAIMCVGWYAVCALLSHNLQCCWARPCLSGWSSYACAWPCAILSPTNPTLSGEGDSLGGEAFEETSFFEPNFFLFRADITLTLLAPTRHAWGFDGACSFSTLDLDASEVLYVPPRVQRIQWMAFLFLWSAVEDKDRGTSLKANIDFWWSCSANCVNSICLIT